MAESGYASAGVGSRIRKVFHRSDLVGVLVLDARFLEQKSKIGFKRHGPAPVCDLQRRQRRKDWGGIAFILVIEKSLVRKCQPKNRDVRMRAGCNPDHA